MKKLFLTAALALCGAALFGQEKKLVVPPFELAAGAKLDAAGLSNLQDDIINAFINTKLYKVPDRKALKVLTDEQKFQLDDWSDEIKSAAMGKVLNADYLVRVVVKHDGEVNVLSAKILDVSTAEGLAAGSIEFTSQREARNKMKDFVSELTAIMYGTAQAASDPAQQATAPPRPAGTSLVLVEGGSFQMGSSNGDNDEKPIHRVTLKSFYMGKYPVTQKEWREVMGSNPSDFKGDNLPVEMVNWYDAVEYCNKRSQKEGLTPAYKGSWESISCDWNANGYRLPTEAEWEYAAKGGKGSPGNYNYSGGDNVDNVAWYKDNSGGTTHAVGTKAPNALGLYDMSGNVWEWCWDWCGDYSGEAQMNPRGASSESFRVLRGGSWYLPAGNLRSASRGFISPDERRGFGPYGRHGSSGFRVVRSTPN